MINYKSLLDHQEKLKQIKETYTKEEVDNFLGFNSKKDKFLALYSIRYKTSKKLFYNGSLTYGYIYKMQYFLNTKLNYFKSWVIYSPLSKYEENPELYLKIAAELNYFLENTTKKHKHLVKKLLNNENEFNFIELPNDVFGEPVFISTTFVTQKTNPNLNIGITGIMINRKISNKIMIMPE